MQITAQGHVHSFGFTYDATHHMDRCECGERINVVEHNFQPAFDEKEHFLQCFCGYKKPKSYGTHVYDSYSADASGHVKACSCGAVDPSSAKTAHNFNTTDANGYPACVCGIIKLNGNVHVHSYHFTYTNDTHMDRCDECGSEINLVPHDFVTAYNDTQHFLKCWCGHISIGVTLTITLFTL